MQMFYYEDLFLDLLDHAKKFSLWHNKTQRQDFAIIEMVDQLDSEADLGLLQHPIWSVLVIIVNGWKPLTVITKRSILDLAAVLDPPLWPYVSDPTQLWNEDLNDTVIPSLICRIWIKLFLRSKARETRKGLQHSVIKISELIITNVKKECLENTSSYIDPIFEALK